MRGSCACSILITRARAYPMLGEYQVLGPGSPAGQPYPLYYHILPCRIRHCKQLIHAFLPL